MRKYCFVFLHSAVLFLLYLLPLSPVFAASLPQVVLSALNSNPRLFAERYAVIARRHDLRGAYSDYWPSIGIRGAIGPEHVSDPAIRQTTRGNPGLVRRESSLRVNELLFSGGERGYIVGQRRADYKEARAHLKEARQIVALSTVEAYLSVLRERAIVAVYQHNVVSHQEMLSKVSLRSTAGAGRISEVQLAKSRLFRAKSRLQEAQSQLAEAEHTYKQFTDLKAGAMSMPSLTPNCFRSSQQVWQAAVWHSPTLAIHRARLKSTHQAIGAARAKFFPRVNLELNAIHNHHIEGVQGDDNALQALLVGSYDLFSGGADLTALKAAKARRYQAYYTLSDTLRRVRSEVFTLWDFFQNDRQRYYDLKKHQKEAYQVWQSYSKEFNLGRRNLFDLLNAETEYYNSQVSTINVRHSWMMDYYRLLALTGYLDQYFNQSTCPLI